MTDIVIVDYGMGNLGSIQNMLKKVGARSTISSDPAVIGGAVKLILPGVGSFDTGMRRLTDLGLLPILNERALSRRVPVLGVCLGMQLLTRGSEEGSLPGLGWISGETVRFRFPDASRLRIPHMGWNTVELKSASPLFDGLVDGESRFYFVHSYFVRCEREEEQLALTTYGRPFVSAVGRANILGVQFHPEKSHRFGMRLLRNFVEKY